MAPSLPHSRVQRISRCILDSTDLGRVGPLGSSNGPTHDPTPCYRPSSLYIHITNILGLSSNFPLLNAIWRPLYLIFSFPSKPLCQVSSPDPFQIYNLCSCFRFKGGVCAFYKINIPIARIMDLEAPHFDALWLKNISLQLLLFFSFFCCSPKPTDFLFFLNILLPAMSHC